MTGPTQPIPDLMSPMAAPYRLAGTNGEAVVLVHGFTGVPAHFRPLAEHLNAAGFTVNVPLLAGHGTTPEHLATTDAGDWERSARLAAEAVSDHRRVHLVGLSMGGLLGIMVAGRVAASTVTTINSPVVVRDKRLYFAGVAHRWRPVVDWDVPGEPNLEEAVERYSIPYPGFHTVSGRELVRVVTRGYRAARRLRRPALVIQSKADQTVDPVSGRLLAGALGPSARLVRLERSAHNALLDRDRHLIHDLVLDHVSA
jgi:carboxylesterase